VPLALLSLELLSAAGRKDTWTQSLYPGIEKRLRPPLAHAIDDGARRILAHADVGVVVGLLVRYAPAERPQTRWASEGTLLILAVWVGASLLFRWYVGSLANCKTPSGQLTIVLVLTGYLFTTSLIFLLGVQLDELARTRRVSRPRSAGRGRGPASARR
jgi:Virulence factor BrkB